MTNELPKEFPESLELAKYKKVIIKGDTSLEHGILEARLGARGDVVFFWRLDFGDNKTLREKIGIWDRLAPPKKATPSVAGYSKVAAINQALALADIHAKWSKQGGSGYPAYLAHIAESQEQIEKDRKKKVEQEARERAEAAKQAKDQSQYTFASLLVTYTGYLASQGKQAAYDARNILKNHVIENHPLIAATLARNVTDEQVADVIRAINEQGKGRTANKARSYIRAAFTLAIKAKTSPKLPLALKGFNIKSNPAATVGIIEGANRTDKNPFNSSEMQAYWQAIESVRGVKGAILRLHLLTGAQRLAQLCRLQTPNVLDDAIRLFDAKGKRNEPREHLVPLTPLAMLQVEVLKATNQAGPYLFSLDHGETACNTSTLNDLARNAVGDAIELFTMKRLRSGVETMLSKAGVSREVRGQLQSHGLNGVQLGSYDANDFIPEKLKALITLQSLLQTKQTKRVLPFTR